MSPESGSAWWTELLLGSVCWVTALGFALASTAIGPFAGFTVVYGRVLVVAYVAVSVGLGAQFLRSGIRKMPEPIRADTGSDGRARDDGIVAGNEGDADPQ